MKLPSWLRGRPASAGVSTADVEAANQRLREAHGRAEDTQNLDAAVERATGRAITEVKYWDIGIPRPDPGRNRHEIAELKLKVREAGILAQATQLELESDKRILRAAKGLKSIAEGIDKTNKERGSVQEEADKLRDELLKSYPRPE